MVSIPVESIDRVDHALDRAVRAKEDGADLVEWRVDPMAEETGSEVAIARLVRECPTPCVVTIRDAREGGGFLGTDEVRRELLLGVIRNARPAYIDVELTTIERDGTLRAALRGLMGATGGEPSATRLILSAHDFATRPADLSRRIAAMQDEPSCSVIKVAWHARSLRDNLEAFELLEARHLPMVALCMGEAGLMSRVLAGRFGALWTYARDDESAGTAPGQPSIRELTTQWSFRELSRDTDLYGVIGWPVAHSRSPILHNQWFRESKRDALYLPLPVPPEWEHFKATLHSLIDDPRLRFRGASVTMPHKEHLIRFVREKGGSIDETAKTIGAANTLVIGHGGSVSCVNTDAPAIALAAAKLLSRKEGDLRGVKALVLGAGGVGAAASWGLADVGADVTIWNRTADRADCLAENLAKQRGGYGPLIVRAQGDESRFPRFDLMVHATSVGMHGGSDPDGLGLPKGATLEGVLGVIETIYAPQETALVQLARSQGVPVSLGIELLECQARLQSAIWQSIARW